jgi:pimeloyl-ACP methyl ester carboxylesterase
MWKTGPQLTIGDLRSIQAPTLLLAGQYDDIKPEHTREMQQAIPDTEMLIFSDVGQGLIHSIPTVVNQAILQFLATEEILQGDSSERLT